MFDVLGSKLWLVKEVNHLTQCSFKFSLDSTEDQLSNATDYFQFSHQDLDHFSVVPIPEKDSVTPVRYCLVFR